MLKKLTKEYRCWKSFNCKLQSEFNILKTIKETVENSEDLTKLRDYYLFTLKSLKQVLDTLKMLISLEKNKALTDVCFNSQLAYIKSKVKTIREKSGDYYTQQLVSKYIEPEIIKL